METSNPRKAGALIINNISMFNEAAILVEEHITGNIFEKFLEIINQWIIKNRWSGETEWMETENTWASPEDWFIISEGEKIKIAEFRLDFEKKERNSYDIANLCECGDSRIGFYFSKGKKKKKKYFNSKIKNISEKDIKLLSFNNSGEKYNGLFLPISLNNKDLAADYENDDFEESMKPLHSALEILLKAKNIFDPIVKELIKSVNQ